MKKIIIALVFVLCNLVSANAQVYDGITQPTTWRIWLPVSVSTEAHSATQSTPFVGYKVKATNWLNFTGVAQWNLGKEVFTPQVWINANYKNFYFLTRNIVNAKNGKYSNTISATYKLPKNFMIDATWSGFFNDGKFHDGNDRLQVVGGVNLGKVIVNSGYQFLGNTKGYVGNVRVKLTDTQWLQFKYDHGVHQFNVAMAMHFN